MNAESVLAGFPAAFAVIALIFFYGLSAKKAWFSSSTLLAGGFLALIFLGSSEPALIKILAVSVCELAAVVIFAKFIVAARISGKTAREWSAELKSLESDYSMEETRRKNLKIELENSEKEILKTLRLYGAVKGLGQSLGWEDMVPHINYAVQQCLGLQHYQLYLLDESSKEAPYRRVISRGTRLGEPPLHAPSAEPRLHENANECYIEVPVRRGQDQIGILWGRANAPQNQPAREQILRDARDLSEELGMGLQKARLFSSLEKLSRMDGLTGVYRRQIFDERLDEELQRARAFRTVFSVLIGDLDHFKQINDTYGHQAGDEILRRVGEILRESVYETDFVARYGGEEFVVIFPQADPAGVGRKAESLRAKIAQESFVWGLDRIGITISVGVAHYPTDGTQPAALLNMADQSLYAAKKWGRNRVVDSSELRRP